MHSKESSQHCMQFILQCEPWSSKEHQGSFAALSKNVGRENNEDGISWLSHLVIWIQFFGDLWNLSSISPVHNMSWNFVANATHPTEGDVILKIIHGKSNAIRERDVIEFFSSDYMVEIIDFYGEDEKYAAILMRKISSNVSMRKACKENLDNAIEPYAKIINEIVAPYEKNKIKSLESRNEVMRMLGSISKIHKKVRNKELIDACNQIKQKLINESQNAQLFILHSDLHLENILQDGKSWVVIDPKGGIGTKENEASAFSFATSKEMKQGPKICANIIKARVNKLANLIQCDSAKILQWRFLRCVSRYSSSFSKYDKRYIECLYYAIFEKFLTL